MVLLTRVCFGGSGGERSNSTSAAASCRSSNLAYHIADQSLSKQCCSIPEPEALTVVTVEVGVVGDKQPQAEVICGLRV